MSAEWVLLVVCCCVVCDSVTSPQVVFSVYFIGYQIGARLRKIITHFGGTEYEVRGDYRSIQKQIVALAIKIEDTKRMLRATELQTRSMLQAIVWDPATNSSPYQNYAHALRVEKSICDTLKKCEVEREGSGVLRCDAWIPQESYPALQAHLKAAVAPTGAQAAASELLPSAHGTFGEPPTYFRTTKFTEPYQGIVDTYGVPRYKEVNPGLFTIISFPFLFGVMYGDVGHGTLLTLAALWFILNERHYNDLVRRKQMDEILGMVFGGRYMLILMGLFAIYAGSIYNDCFSIPLNIFGTRFTFGSAANTQGSVEGQPLANTQHYPYGVDPSWYHTSNELAFFNSLKMKLAVTLGVAQMTFGIVLSYLNHSYFQDRLAVVCEFIPRMIFMLATFGYMIFLIVFKFCVDWSQSPIGPPNLVQTMIAMFLAPGQVDADKQLYPGQAVVQAVLLLAALVSVPVMLLGQPLIARAQHNKLWPNQHKALETKHDHHHSKHKHSGSSASYQSVPSIDAESSDDEEEQKLSRHIHHHGDASAAAAPAAAPVPVAAAGGHGADPTDEHYNFSDHAITQGIHTIEFVLGAVSNTASYLRLWALSLAHAELSAVFWDKMISQYGLEQANPALMVVGMAAWMCATFAVLLAMDVLECFLHALRLHWVRHSTGRGEEGSCGLGNGCAPLGMLKGAMLVLSLLCASLRLNSKTNSSTLTAMRTSPSTSCRPRCQRRKGEGENKGGQEGSTDNAQANWMCGLNRARCPIANRFQTLLSIV